MRLRLRMRMVPIPRPMQHDGRYLIDGTRVPDRALLGHNAQVQLAPHSGTDTSQHTGGKGVPASLGTVRFALALRSLLPVI